MLFVYGSDNTILGEINIDASLDFPSERLRGLMDLCEEDYYFLQRIIDDLKLKLQQIPTRDVKFSAIDIGQESRIAVRFRSRLWKRFIYIINVFRVEDLDLQKGMSNPVSYVENTPPSRS